MYNIPLADFSLKYFNGFEEVSIALGAFYCFYFIP